MRSCAKEETESGLGSSVLHEESGAAAVIGYDGVTFIDHLQPLNHLRIGSGAGQCTVEFAYQSHADGGLPVIGPLVCQPAAVAP